MVDLEVIDVLLICHLEDGVHELTIENILGLVIPDNIVGHQIGSNFIIAEQLAFLEENSHLIKEFFLRNVELSLDVLELSTDSFHLTVVED